LLLPLSFCEGNDDGYLVANNHNELIKVDNHGNLVWDSLYNGLISDIVSISNQHYLIAGTKNNSNTWLAKIDNHGTLIWEKEFIAGGYDYCHDLLVLPNGEYLLVGQSNSDAGDDKSENSRGTVDYWIIKTDNQGNKIWDKTFGGIDSDRALNATLLNDGNILIGGQSQSNISGDKSQNNKGGNFNDYWKCD